MKFTEGEEGIFCFNRCVQSVNCAWFYGDISTLNCCIWDRNVCKWCLILCLTYNPSVQAQSIPASTKQYIACRTRMSPGTHLLCHPLLSLMACFSFHFSAQMLLSWHCLCSFSLFLNQIEIQETKDPRFCVQRFHWEPKISSSSSSFVPRSPILHLLHPSPVLSSAGETLLVWVLEVKVC